mgnify:CR=1 FL=1
MGKLTALLAGLIFGLGLLLAGMANPAKVIAFLDLAGGAAEALGRLPEATQAALRAQLASSIAGEIDSELTCSKV